MPYKKLIVTISMLLTAAIVSTHANATLVRIAGTDDPAPDGNGLIDTIRYAPTINDQGHVAIVADHKNTNNPGDDSQGIYLITPTATHLYNRANNLTGMAASRYEFFGLLHLNNQDQITYQTSLTNTPGGNDDDTAVLRDDGPTKHFLVQENDPSPDFNGEFSDIPYFFRTSLADNGQSVLQLNLRDTSDPSGLFRAEPGNIEKIARSNDTVPGGDGKYSSFLLPHINSGGIITFQANLKDTSGGTTDDEAIYQNESFTTTQIVRAGEATPEGFGTYDMFIGITANDHNQVAFKSLLTGTPGGSDDDEAVYLANSPGDVTKIARQGQPAPDTFGPLDSPGAPVLNNNSQVAFSTTAIFDQSSYRGDGTTLTPLLSAGSPALDGNGILESHFSEAIDESPAVAMLVHYIDTADPGNDQNAVVISDGIDAIQIIRNGDTFGPNTVTAIKFNTDARIDPINKHSQVTFSATLQPAVGPEKHNVYIYTPDLHWRSTLPGFWDNPKNWTLTQQPGRPHHTTIDPANSLTVQGPASPVNVTSLTLGGGTGLATLELNGGTITPEQPLSILATGILTGDGSIQGDATNHGTVTANNLTITGTLTNHSLIQGSGRINATLDNQPSGQIRLATGDDLHFTGSTSSNAGRIEAIDASIEFQQQLNNNTPTGNIVARDATLRFNGGLNNAGGVGFSFGTSDLFGDILNQPSGSIVVSGGSDLTIYDDVINNGNIQASPGSNIVYFGNVTGTGSFPGSGNHFFEADLAPGASPGINTFGGNVHLGFASTLKIEAQTPITPATTPTAGIDFDQMTTAGTITLGGTLDINLLDTPTRPNLGTTFDILTYNNRTTGSMFHTINGTIIDNDFALAPLFDDTTNTLTLRATIPGDINLDNKVSIADLTIMALNFNTSAPFYNAATNTNTWQLGDFNTDGAITIADLALLALNFGFNAADPTSTPTPLSLTDAATLAGIDPAKLPGVPEPTTAALFTLLAAATHIPRPRHRHH